MSKIIDNSLAPIDERATHLFLTRADQLRALGDDRRRRILYLLDDAPRSISDLAEEFGVPRGTLGYHVKLLERAGLIRVVRTEQRRGLVEKYYAKTAQVFVVRAEGQAADDLSAVAATGLREAANEVHLGEDRARSTYGHVHVRLRPEDAERFVRRLRRLLVEFGQADDERGEDYGLVGALWKRPGSA